MTKWLARTLLIAALCSVLSGCSALQLGYNSADTLLHWRASQYFSFDGEQKAAYERRVQRFLGWHRRTALPQYARLAHEMGDRLARGISQADLAWGYDSFQVQLRQSLQAGSEEMGELLDALSPGQTERFQTRLAKENREYAKKNGLAETPAERRAMRVKRNVERLEDWFGALTDAQKERVGLYSARAPLDDALRDRDRRRLQEELLAMVQAKEAKKRLTPWALAWEHNRDPVYASMRSENQQEYYSMMLDLDKMLSAEQRNRAVQRLRGFAGDFVALSALAGAAR